MIKYSERMDRVFHALADPTRRDIVDRLCVRPMSVSELARPLSMTLPGVVAHLRVLEGSGLVRSSKAGRVRTCRVDPGALRAAEAWIAERRTEWERRFDRLGELLGAPETEPESESRSKHDD
ncbi:MAG: metalloregulator ArsR/SmtB family transcription factor [Acidimicrobiia bacterium]